MHCNVVSFSGRAKKEVSVGIPCFLFFIFILRIPCGLQTCGSIFDLALQVSH